MAFRFSCLVRSYINSWLWVVVGGCVIVCLVNWYDWLVWVLYFVGVVYTLFWCCISLCCFTRVSYLCLALLLLSASIFLSRGVSADCVVVVCWVGYLGLVYIVVLVVRVDCLVTIRVYQ